MVNKGNGRGKGREGWLGVTYKEEEDKGEYDCTAFVGLQMVGSPANV